MLRLRQRSVLPGFGLICEHPASLFVYDFLGNVNLFHGRIEQGGVQLSKEELRDLELQLGEVVQVELRKVRVFTHDYSI